MLHVSKLLEFLQYITNHFQVVSPLADSDDIRQLLPQVTALY